MTWPLSQDYNEFVQALAAACSGEVGHPTCQHPQRLPEQAYGPEMDRFSLLIVVVALRCLRAGGRWLWDCYDSGDNLLSPLGEPVFPDKEQPASRQETPPASPSYFVPPPIRRAPVPAVLAPSQEPAQECYGEPAEESPPAVRYRSDRRRHTAGVVVLCGLLLAGSLALWAAVAASVEEDQTQSASKPPSLQANAAPAEKPVLQDQPLVQPDPHKRHRREEVEEREVHHQGPELNHRQLAEEAKAGRLKAFVGKPVRVRGPVRTIRPAGLIEEWANKAPRGAVLVFLGKLGGGDHPDVICVFPDGVPADLQRGESRGIEGTYKGLDSFSGIPYLTDCELIPEAEKP